MYHIDYIGEIKNTSKGSCDDASRRHGKKVNVLNFYSIAREFPANAKPLQ